MKAPYPISSSCRFPSRWQPLSGIRRSRGSQFALRPIKTMSVSPRSPRARVSGDRPVTHSLAFFPPNSVVGRRAFVFLPFVFDPVHPRVRLSRHPNVLFGNMSSERQTHRPQSVAFSNVRVRPSVCSSSSVLVRHERSRESRRGGAGRGRRRDGRRWERTGRRTDRLSRR